MIGIHVMITTLYAERERIDRAIGRFEDGLWHFSHATAKTGAERPCRRKNGWRFRGV